MLEEVFVLAIPKAYQIDSDVKLKPKYIYIYMFFDVIYATTFWQEEPLQISFIPLYCMWLTYLIPEPVRSPAHHLNCCISFLTFNRRYPRHFEWLILKLFKLDGLQFFHQRLALVCLEGLEA